MKWQNLVVGLSLLSNVILCIMFSQGTVFGQTSISVPPLTKGGGYIVVIPPKSVSCVELETKLGLNRGDIVSISTDPRDGDTIIFNKDVALTSSQVQMASDIVKGLVPNIMVK